MPAALLPPRGWQALRRASEAGVEDSVLAEKYHVPGAAIRQRRKREKWLTPQRLEEAQAVAIARAQTKTVGGGAVSRMSRVDDGEGGLTHVAEELTTLAEAGSLRFAQLAHDALKRSKKLVIRSVGDAVAAAKGLRSVAGLDKETGVTVNVGSWSARSVRDVGADLYDE